MTAYTIPTCNLSALREALAKLAKKAAKLGCEPVGFTVTATRIEAVTHQIEHEEGGGHAETEQREVADIELFGTAPKLAGWSFIGRIEVTEHEGKSATFMYAAPGKEIPKAYRDQPHHCDHCNTERMRKDTFVVANDNGETKRVGRNCLRDFLGHKDPNAIASFLQQVYELIERVRSGGYSSGGWSDPMHKLIELLPQLVAIIRVKGWVTSKMWQRAHDEGWPTIPDTSADVLKQIINPFRIAVTSKEEAARISKLKADCAVTDADKLAIPGVMELMSREGDGTDFWANLNTVVRIGASPVKQWGLLAAATGMWFKEQGKLAERAKVNNEYLPVMEGAKLAPMKVTLHKMIVIPGGQWGDRYMHQFRDEANHVIIWWATTGRICNEGETITIKGTVKKFDEYKGLKQTVLTRVKLVEAAANV